MNYPQQLAAMFPKLGMAFAIVLSPLASGQTDSSGGPSAGDWTSIRSAYQAEQHRVLDTESGLQARNPGQRWLAKFDGSGSLVVPDGASWSWGLQLQAFGFEGALQRVNGSAKADAHGNRIAYDWTDNLQEWYVNDTRGLEHGFTLQSRPQGNDVSETSLVMDLAVRGSLLAEVFGNGSGARFIDAQGKTVLTYAGLHVYDADGVSHRAVMVGGGQHLRFSIDESDARYPLTIDPIAQQAYLKALATDTFDGFGASVAISGDLAVVGACFEDSNATGVNGDPHDNSLNVSGAAYVFERSGSGWIQAAYLKASNPDAADYFGYSVAISGDLLVVGAFAEDSNATGVDGNQGNAANSAASSSGAAYVFERIAGTWSQQAYLKASNTGRDDLFGWSVAISGELIVVGAVGESGGSTGVDGNQGNSNQTDSGAAYIFERIAGTWSQSAYLKASNTGVSDKFGQSVAISGEIVAIGAVGEDSSARGVDGVQGNDNISASGAVYVFERNAGTWSQQAYLKASNNWSWGAEFGGSVSVSGERVLVGAIGEASNATGVNGDEDDHSAGHAGAAYLFARNAGIWSQQAYLKASNTQGGDVFGTSVAISGDRVVVSAMVEDSAATGINGDQSDNSKTRSGAVYAFEGVGGNWSQSAYMKASNPDSTDQFGISVALSNGVAIVGADQEDSNALGVNGDQADNSKRDSGAAYIFDLGATSANFCGTAEPNSSGFSATISTTGSLNVSTNNLSLHATGLPTGQFGYFLNSQGQAFISNPGGSQGNLCLGGAPMGRHNRSFEVGFSGASGTIDLTLDLTDIPTPNGTYGIVAGETWNFQCWFRDMNPGSTSNFTDGISVLFH